MKKLYDTNVLIDYPEIILEDKNLVLPYSVLQELEKLKRKEGLFYKARKALKNILNNIDTIEFINDEKLPIEHTDDKLIEICLKKGYKLVTEDILLYLRAKSLLKEVEYFQINTEMYSGVRDYILDKNLIAEAYDKGFISCDNIDIELNENEFLDCDSVILRKRDTKLFKVDWEKNRSFISKNFKLNRRQLMAYDLLTDTTVPLVAIWGKYGTGKTSLAIKTAIKLMNKDIYDEVLIARPKIETGYKEEHLGILPGEVEEKLAPYLQPFHDNISENNFLRIKVQPLSTIKGRDIENTLFVVDESSDIEPSQMPMLIERIGKGSKLILIGDPNQVDNPRLSTYNNGLTFTVNNLQGQYNFGCVKLNKNERSEVAMLGEVLRGNL